MGIGSAGIDTIFNFQYGTLQKKNLTHFDSWASTFDETTTAIELAPEGTGYRARTRFAKFFNLPELMNMFKEVADIKTSDQLNLPVPKAKFKTTLVVATVTAKSRKKTKQPTHYLIKNNPALNRPSMVLSILLLTSLHE